MPTESDPALADPALRPVRLYGSSFWIAYLANLLLTTANSLTFRFADFVDFLHGSAATAGMIVGIATGVGVPVRLLLGRIIDRWGPKHVWVLSAAAFVASCEAFVPLDRIGPAVYLIRIVYSSSVSAAYCCSTIHIWTDVPSERRAELIGSLGTSGFIGMILGPQLGDWIFRFLRPGPAQFATMFLACAALGAAYLALVIYLMRNVRRPEPHVPPPLGRMLVEYWPGLLVMVGMMMGISLVVPFTFLTRFAHARNLGGFGLFFWFYAPTAIVLRVIGRRWPEQLGRRAAATIGLACQAISMLLYTLVDNEWQLAWPALAAGTGHALLFPSVTTLGAESFPDRHRATGTMLILGSADFGMLCGAPTLGLIIDHLGFPAMFYTSSAVGAIVGATFATASAAGTRRPGGLNCQPLE